MPYSKNNLKTLLNPQSIAIVGATEKKGKVGNVTAKNILNLGYAGDVFLVNPKYSELFGKKCYPCLEEIDKKIDLAIIIIPAKFVNDTIKKVADKVKNFAIISSGFSEIGAVGEKRENKLIKIAQENNLNILGPNCLGFINPETELNASFAGGMPKAGNIAFISQSGALAVAIMDAAKKEGMRFSSLVSMGNKAQIDEADLIEYFADDENTQVIAVYIESVKNGEKFMRIAQKVSTKKPIIILKAGRTKKSQKAIASHTGALAGSSKIMSALFEKVGILQASNLEKFFDLIKFASNYNTVSNNKTIIVTNAGGPGVLTADAFNEKEIELAEINEKTKKELKDFLPDESSVENPIDLLGDAWDDRFKKTFSTISRADAGLVICVLTPQDQTPCEKIAQEIVNFKNKTNKAVVTVFIGGEKIASSLDILRESNIPNFSFPEKAVTTLNKYYQWRIFTSSIHIQEKLETNNKRAKKALAVIQKAQIENRHALLFAESKKIMDLYGIGVIETINANSNKEINLEKIEFPVVIKIDSDKILHKTDQQGIILNIKSQKELGVSMEKMRNNFPGENIIIQPMLEIQNELILGIKRDAVFGPVVICGLGGIYTEIFKMADFFILPMNITEIENRLRKSRVNFLFKKTRGRKACNITELANILLKLMLLAKENKKIKELDINPISIYNNKKSLAIDIKIII